MLSSPVPGLDVFDARQGSRKGAGSRSCAEVEIDADRGRGRRGVVCIGAAAAVDRVRAARGEEGIVAGRPEDVVVAHAALDVFDAGQRVEPGRRGERVSGAAARIQIDIGAAGARRADVIGFDAVAAVDGLVARLRDEVARDNEADVAARRTDRVP